MQTKNIHRDNRIYTGCTTNDPLTGGFKDDYPYSGDKLEEGQEVVVGIDYKLQHQVIHWTERIWLNVTKDQYDKVSTIHNHQRIVAIGIPKATEKEKPECDDFNFNDRGECTYPLCDCGGVLNVKTAKATVEETPIQEINKGLADGSIVMEGRSEKTEENDNKVIQVIVGEKDGEQNELFGKIEQLYAVTEEKETQPERFKRPTDDQIVKAAIVFNEGRMNPEELTNMVSLADWIIDRLYENGDITIPAVNETNP